MISNSPLYERSAVCRHTLIGGADGIGVFEWGAFPVPWRFVVDHMAGGSHAYHFTVTEVSQDDFFPLYMLKMLVRNKN